MIESMATWQLSSLNFYDKTWCRTWVGFVALTGSFFFHCGLLTVFKQNEEINRVLRGWLRMKGVEFASGLPRQRDLGVHFKTWF